jgi:aminoglycoside 6'-N-acetyltransferase
VIPLPVSTERLAIDPLTADDAEAVAAYRSRPEVARYQGWALPYTAEQAVRLAANGQLALRHRRELVGDAMVAPVAGVDHVVELGITLAPSAQGRGLAQEAVVGLVDACFASTWSKAMAYVDRRNERSLRLFDRVGFRREGRLHRSYRRSGGWVDEVLFGLTADLWRPRSRPGVEPEVELDPHPADLAFLEARLYEGNVAAVGVDDGVELAMLERDDLGRIVAGVAGVAWAGGAELRQLWVEERCRGGGVGRRLVGAFEEAARAHGVAKVFLATHTFQAQGFYERLGYEVTGRWDGWPAGHGQVFMQKEL